MEKTKISTDSPKRGVVPYTSQQTVPRVWVQRTTASDKVLSLLLHSPTSGLSQSSGVSAVVVACDVAITGHQTVIRFLNQLTVSHSTAREIPALMSLQVDQEMALLQGRGHPYFVLLWFWSLFDLISSECGLIMIGRENRQVSFPSFPQNGEAKKYLMKRKGNTWELDPKHILTV